METVFKDPVTNLDWALYYHRELDWVVFPLYEMEDGICTCGKDCEKDAGKHPRITKDWQDIRSNTEEQIVAWWTKWPNANIAVHVGASSLCVADCDKGFDSSEAIPAHVLEHGTVQAISGSGYTHTYCEALPDGYHLVKGQPGVGKHVDIQLGDHYIVATPSNHKSGEVYHWKKGFEPSKSNLPAAIPMDLLKKYGTLKKASAKAKAKAKGSVAWSVDFNDYGERIPANIVGNVITENWISDAVKTDNPDWESSFAVVKGLQLKHWTFRKLCTYITEDGDRSAHLVHCVYELCKEGFNDNQITHLLKIMSIGTHPENKIDDRIAGGYTEYLSELIANKREQAEKKLDASIDHTWQSLSVAEQEEIFRNVESGFDVSDSSIAKYLARTLVGFDGYEESRGWMCNQGHCFWKIDKGQVSITEKIYNFIHRIVDLNPKAKMRANEGKAKSIRKALARELVLDEDLFNSPERYWYISCPNGLVDLRTGKFSDRTDLYFTHQTSCNYNPDEGFKDWENQVWTSCNGNADTYRSLELFHGLLITGETFFRRGMVLMGETGSGKTTLMAPISLVLSSYAVPTERGVFIAGAKVQTFMEELLPGCRLIEAFEVGNMRGLKQEYLKKTLSGGEAMAFRAIREKPGTYINEGTPVFSTNDFNIPLDTFDDATFIRLHFFHIYKTWSDDEEDSRIIARFTRETKMHEQVLNYMVQAAGKLHKLFADGKNIPEHKESVLYKRHSKLIRSPVEEWYKDCIVKDKISRRIPSSDYIDSFWQWEQEMELGLERGEYNPATAISLHLKLKNHGKRFSYRKKAGGGTAYTGFKINPFELTEDEIDETDAK